MSWLERKAPITLAGVLASAILLVSGSRAWASGTVDDPVLGNATISATGHQAVSALVAVALVGAAGLVTAATGGRLTRLPAATIAALAGAGLTVLAMRVVLNPAAVIGPVAAAQAGRTGAIESHSEAMPWSYIGVAAAVMLMLSGAGAALASRRWGSLSAKYDRATAPADGGRESLWDQLDAGEDPTVD